MPRAPLLLLPLLLVGQLAAAPPEPPSSTAPAAAPASVFVIADTANDTLTIADNVAHTVLAEPSNITVAELLEANNDTLAELDGEHDPIVRKKRTFGDIVFRGLADVLGYQVARKPAQEAFPPPLAPVPGIDIPLQAAPAPAPAPAIAAPPCGTPRAAGPPPCRVQRPPPPPPPPPPPKPAPPPCPKPRAVPRPKPRPPPPPPPPSPCGKGRANPATPAPCAPAPPKVQAESNLETVSSNFRLDFNFNRAPATPATQAAEEAQPEEQVLEQEQFNPIAIQPRAAKLPLEEPRKPRVYVDAFVVMNGVARRVDALDAKHLNANGQQGVADTDYLAYDDDAAQSQDDVVQTQDDTIQTQDDDYDDMLQYRDRSKVVHDFGTAVNRFWEQKQMKKKKKKKKVPSNDYRDVHFGNRDLADEIRRRNGESHQSLQRERPKTNRIPLPLPDAEEDTEVTTTTQDPRRRLKPRVLPPTEKNPGQIDTVTVRVPPIYKERHPKKLHRDYEQESVTKDDYNENHSAEVSYRRPKGHEQHNQDDQQERQEQEDHQDQHEYHEQHEQHQQHQQHEQHRQPEHHDDDDNEHEASSYNEAPRRKRRKHSRRTRSVDDSDPFSAGDFDYYGKKLPISKEEELYRGLTIPPPTLDPDLARLEESPESNGHFLDDSERLRDDRERIKDKDERQSEEEQPDESDRSDNEGERTNSNERVDEKEITDELSPNAKIQETGYQNKFEEATSKKIDANQTRVKAVKRRRTKIVPKT